MQEISYVYILSNGFKHLYIGVTANLDLRIQQHKGKSDPNSVTARYNINQLVYFERFTEVESAIAREKQLKRWSRIKKIRLIVAQNPTWRDLSEDGNKVDQAFRGKGPETTGITSVLTTHLISTEPPPKARHLDRSAEWRGPCISLLLLPLSLLFRPTTPTTFGDKTN